jgi:GH24 family phage-related lysozyme (muramidase)
MANTFTTSEAGFELIRRFEGCEKRLPDGRITAYKIGNDPVTCGWGQTGQMPDGRPIVMGLTITQQEADDALQYFVRNVTEPLVRKHFNARTQYEFDALVSWTYNISAAKLERGLYSLPSLVNLKDRDIDAIISKLIEYVNPKTIFEQGLYRRRLAEACMFLGLPWQFALTAVLKRVGGVIVERTDPYFVIEMAESAAEKKTAEKPPEPPKPAPAPKPAEKAKPAPTATPAPPVAVGTKPPSPNTKQPAEVPYKIDPNAGLKPLEESERAVGYFWQNMARLLLRLTGMGTFGTAAAGVANVVQTDAVLGSALMDLTIPVLVLATGVAIAFVSKQYGDWRRARGEASAQQGLY